jgi:sigma-E factor negative regulatory protein RseB
MKRGGKGETRGAPRAAWQALLALSAVCVSLAAPASTELSAAHQQLERMTDALRSLSYEGTLVYLHDHHLETLHIVHRIVNGRAHEQLVSLNGPVRQVTREHDQVVCELPDSVPISVRRRGLPGEVLRSPQFDPDALSPNYLVHPLGSARVAGRQTEVVGIIPRDGMRYGYRFYLDRDSGLPLKSDLMGSAAQPIEQIMFTTLKVLAEEPGPAGASPAPAAGAVAEGAGAPPTADDDGDVWRFDALPPGFEVVMHDHWRDGAGVPVEHIVLSDGLASVSVYVEEDTEDGLTGGTRFGAIHAMGGRVAGHQVTVVGEVPAATVQAVLAAVRYEGEDE